MLNLELATLSSVENPRLKCEGSAQAEESLAARRAAVQTLVDQPGRAVARCPLGVFIRPSVDVPVVIDTNTKLFHQDRQ
jgi:hypothetical protein